MSISRCLWIGVLGLSLGLLGCQDPESSATFSMVKTDLGDMSKEPKMAKEQSAGVVTMKGTPHALVGNKVRVGDKAPDFVVVDNGLKEVKLAAYKGKTLIVTSVPSLDTSVCDIETHKFNEAAGQLGPIVQILTISMDLPFAQKRWCGASGVNNLQTLSDYRYASFGQAYGVLIEDLRLLARAVFVVDRTGTIRYIQVVPELGQEPDYQAALDAVKQLPQGLTPP